MQETSTDDKNEVPFSDSPYADEDGKSNQIKREDGKLRTLSGRIINCQGKNVRINIPLTTPSRTFSAISYLVREDLLNQSSRKCGQKGGKIHVNKTKLHHAEKMIKGGFIELYKGLGYLKVYRYDNNPKTYRLICSTNLTNILDLLCKIVCFLHHIDFQELEYACILKDFEEV